MISSRWISIVPAVDERRRAAGHSRAMRRAMRRADRRADRFVTRRAIRRAFTLIELLMVIAMIALLSSAVMFAMWGVLDEAKADRTRSQIQRIDQSLQPRWDAYLTRTIPLNLSNALQPNVAAYVRLAAIRDLMRMEMPDRITDIVDPPVILFVDPSTNTPVRLSIPTLLRGYRRICYAKLGPDPNNASLPNYAKWSSANEGAECLYLILSSMNEEGTNAVLDFTSPSEIGDVDGDGMPEILDAWGRPIQYLRWAPGFYSDRQSQNPANDPDPFDPLKVDPRWSDAATGNEPFLLFPLIFSAGSDGLFDINADGGISPVMNGAFRYVATDQKYGSQTPVRNDPYWIGDPASPSPAIGTLMDTNGNGKLDYGDNIHNHLLEVK